MSRLKVSRRTLISSLAGSAAFAGLRPLLPWELRSAEGATPPRRMISFFHPMGFWEPSFWPTGTPGGTWQLGETLAGLERLKPKLIFPDGLLTYGALYFQKSTGGDNNHGAGMTLMFSGSAKSGSYATGPSIEQAVAQHLVASNPNRWDRARWDLGFGTGAPGGHSTCFFLGSGQPVNPQNNPKAAFDDLTRVIRPSGATVDETAIARLRAQKKSVIDAVLADLNSVCARVGAAEKQKCEAHLDGIRMLENRLKTLTPSVSPGCTQPAAPVVANGDAVATIQAQMDLIVAAFACDLTPVASMQIGHADGGVSFESLFGQGQHDVTHAVSNGGNQFKPEIAAIHKKIDLWYAERIGYLLNKLDSIPEGQGTMLDNTLVLFGTDTTTQSDRRVCGAHSIERIPMFMAGGGAFAFKTGRWLKYPNRSPSANDAPLTWTPHHRLLTSIARAFGMNVDSFGNAGWGSGPLVGLEG